MISLFQETSMALPQRQLRTAAPNAVLELQKLLDLTDEELAFILRTSHRTVARWADDQPPEDNARLLKLQELVALAKETFKVEAIAEWFREPNRALGGFVPLNLAADPHGQELLKNMLYQAAYGLPL
jgi:uncharacterized protein (DUF2384 family)